MQHRAARGPSAASRDARRDAKGPFHGGKGVRSTVLLPHLGFPRAVRTPSDRFHTPLQLCTAGIVNFFTALFRTTTHACHNPESIWILTSCILKHCWILRFVTRLQRQCERTECPHTNPKCRILDSGFWILRSAKKYSRTERVARPHLYSGFWILDSQVSAKNRAVQIACRTPPSGYRALLDRVMRE